MIKNRNHRSQDRKGQRSGPLTILKHNDFPHRERSTRNERYGIFQPFYREHFSGESFGVIFVYITSTCTLLATGAQAWVVPLVFHFILLIWNQCSSIIAFIYCNYYIINQLRHHVARIPRDFTPFYSLCLLDSFTTQCGSVIINRPAVQYIYYSYLTNISINH